MLFRSYKSNNIQYNGQKKGTQDHSTQKHYTERLNNTNYTPGRVRSYHSTTGTRVILVKKSCDKSWKTKDGIATATTGT